jgi:hypothetical protein
MLGRLNLFHDLWQRKFDGRRRRSTQIVAEVLAALSATASRLNGNENSQVIFFRGSIGQGLVISPASLDQHGSRASCQHELKDTHPRAEQVPSTLHGDGSSANSEVGNTMAAEHHAHGKLDRDGSIAHVLVALAAEFSSDNLLDDGASPEEFLAAHAFNAVKGLVTKKDFGVRVRVETGGSDDWWL